MQHQHHAASASCSISIMQQHHHAASALGSVPLLLLSHALLARSLRHVWSHPHVVCSDNGGGKEHEHQTEVHWGGIRGRESLVTLGCLLGVSWAEMRVFSAHVGVCGRVWECVRARACAREMARMLIYEGVRPRVQQPVALFQPLHSHHPTPPPAGASSVARSCDSRKGLHFGRAIMCLLARQLYYGTLLWDTLSVGGTRTWEVRERGFRV